MRLKNETILILALLPLYTYQLQFDLSCEIFSDAFAFAQHLFLMRSVTGEKDHFDQTRVPTFATVISPMSFAEN